MESGAIRGTATDNVTETGRDIGDGRVEFSVVM